MAKYLTLGGLEYFKQKLQGLFAPLVHTHEIDDVDNLRDELDNIRTSIARTYYAAHFHKNRDDKDTYTAVLPIEDISEYIEDMPTDEALLYEAYIDETDTENCILQLPLNSTITGSTITL